MIVRHYDNMEEYRENLLIDEEYKHSHIISYRWLVLNSGFQGLCLLTITLIMFLFDLIRCQSNSGVEVHMQVLNITIEDFGKVSMFEFGPNSDTCKRELKDYPRVCDEY